MRRIMIGSVILMILMSYCAWTFAEDAEDAEKKAREIHNIATSDVIYTQEETKALYYQNVQIIDLLRQIRDLLQRQRGTEERNG